jgi:uncharacterized protein YdeI (YjbR/CyaY-like superfamily)
LRQWRFTSKAQVNELKILEYVAEAIEIEQKGLKIKPDKFKPIPLPELLENEFKKDNVLKSAFEKITPGKQKEYIIYINEAKQEVTKQKRLDNIKPMIIEGIGLNDKYK